MTTREETTQRSAHLVEEALHLRKRALVARLTAMQACLRSEDVLGVITLKRMLLSA